MPYLVDIAGLLDGPAASQALEDAFVRIATEAAGLGVPRAAGITFDALRAQFNKRTVTLSAWKHPNGALVIGGGEWDRGEVETNLRQVEVIILALRTEILRPSVRVRVCPTQQGGFDAEGVIGEEPWVLEAYGGVDITNNGKLAKDAEALRTAPVGTKRYFACRPGAWGERRTRRTPAGEFSLVNDPAKDDVRLFTFAPV